LYTPFQIHSTHVLAAVSCQYSNIFPYIVVSSADGAVRCELGSVMYAANVLGSRGPRKMQVALPGKCKCIVIVCCCMCCV